MLSAPHVGGSVEKFVEIIACQLLPWYLCNFALKTKTSSFTEIETIFFTRIPERKIKDLLDQESYWSENNFTLVDGFLDCLSV